MPSGGWRRPGLADQVAIRADRLSRRRRAVRRRRQRRDGRGGRPGLLARLSRSHRAPAQAGRPGRAAVHLDPRALFDGYAANADFIQTYIFPGGMLISEPRFAEIARSAGLELAGPRRASAALCRDAEALARALRCGGGGGAAARRLRRALPPSVALLSDVLRRRLPRRRDRRRASDAWSRSDVTPAKPGSVNLGLDRMTAFAG